MPAASARRLPELEPFPDATGRTRLKVIDDERRDERLDAVGRRHPNARVAPATGALEASPPSIGAPPPRRTVVIGGPPTPTRRRSSATSRHAARPDRLALWAVGLALFMAFMAAATARADAPPAGPVAAHAAATTR